MKRSETKVGSIRNAGSLCMLFAPKMKRSETKVGSIAFEDDCSTFRGSRCPVCFWALYDGDYCQNSDCIRYGNSVHDPVHLSNKEAQERIKANAIAQGREHSERPTGAEGYTS